MKLIKEKIADEAQEIWERVKDLVFHEVNCLDEAPKKMNIAVILQLNEIPEYDHQNSRQALQQVHPVKGFS